MTVYILCHSTLPNYPVPPNSRIIWLNSAEPDNSRGFDIIRGYDYFDNAAELHQNIAGALGPMVIRRVIEEERDESDVVTIWQYRKFLSRTRYGYKDRDQPMQSLTEKMARGLRINDDERTADNFLLCEPVPLGTLYEQYVKLHSIQDLLRYTAIAVDCGALTPEETTFFFKAQHMIPCGIELGSFPKQWWLETFRKMEPVGMIFAEEHVPTQPDDPYQKRAVSFCQERLGAHLLLKEIFARYGQQIPMSMFGALHNVSSDGIYRVGV